MWRMSLYMEKMLGTDSAAAVVDVAVDCCMVEVDMTWVDAEEIFWFDFANALDRQSLASARVTGCNVLNVSELSLWPWDIIRELSENGISL